MDEQKQESRLQKPCYVDVIGGTHKGRSGLVVEAKRGDKLIVRLDGTSTNAWVLRDHVLTRYGELPTYAPKHVRPKRKESCITHDLTFDEYAAIDAEHFSGLKALDVSPLHYLSARVSTPTEAMRVGRALHELVCEPNALGIAVYEGRRAGKDWDAFAEANTRKTILSAKEHALVQAMRAALEKNTMAKALFAHGRGEATVRWVDDGISCKARVDWLLPDGGMVELKTSLSVAPRAFASACASRLYHAQIAFYSYGLNKAQGFAPPSHTIVAIEKKTPHDCVVYRVGREVLEAGERKVVGWLDKLRECKASGMWPGISGDGVVDLKLPDWALTDGLPDVEMEDGDD